MINNFDKLLSEIEINRVQDRFEKEIVDVLEEAIKKHHNIQTGGIPLWFYAVLIFFAYDDILAWCMTPFIFYPLMLVTSITAMLYSMGMAPIMVPVATSVANQLLRRGGVPYQF